MALPVIFSDERIVSPIFIFVSCLTIFSSCVDISWLAPDRDYVLKFTNKSDSSIVVTYYNNKECQDTLISRTLYYTEIKSNLPFTRSLSIDWSSHDYDYPFHVFVLKADFYNSDRTVEDARKYTILRYDFSEDDVKMCNRYKEGATFPPADYMKDVKTWYNLEE